MSDYNFWPNISASFTNYANSDTVEQKFYELWSSAYPVLTSSARISIILALKNNQISRGDYVGLPPFISPCVVKSVSTQAMPNYQENQKNHSTIIYHQYGYLQDVANCENLIEDAVDSLCMPNTELLPSGGRYEIWSLPKIFGTSAGSIIWCRNKEDANLIRQYRDSNNKHNLLQWALRVFGKKWVNLYYYWEGSELYSNGRLPKIAIGEVNRRIDSLDSIVEDRLKKIDALKHLIPQQVNLSKNRLPCLIPLLQVNSNAKPELKELGFGLSDRHMQALDNEIIKFFPLPIHQEVPIGKLLQAERIVKSK
jgi:putative PLP-dependent aminotransferase (TIGR04422 family)